MEPGTCRFGYKVVPAKPGIGSILEHFGVFNRYYRWVAPEILGSYLLHALEYLIAGD